MKVSICDKFPCSELWGVSVLITTEATAANSICRFRWLVPALSVLLRGLGVSAGCATALVRPKSMPWVIQGAFLDWRAHNACEQACV